MPGKLIELDKLQRLDHDTIVRMEAKLDGLIVDVKSMSDGTAIKIADHESRLKMIESDIIYIGGMKDAWSRFLKVESFIHDGKVTANAYRVLAGIVGGATFFMLVQIPNILKTWGLIK